MRFRQKAFAIAILLSLLVLPTAARPQVPSQNLPPPGGYQSIPNFSGPGAGLLFRTAINDRFSGVQPISPRLVTLSFSNLPAEQDGLLIYCADCQNTIPCTSGGSGAWAFGQNGQWTCTAPNAPANVLYQGASGASLNGLTNTGNESVAGTFSATGAATLARAAVNTIVGSGTAPALSGMIVNGRIAVTAYGASGAGINVTTGSISASSASLSVASASGWKSGMGIVVPHAGAPETMTTPGAPTVATVGTTGSTTYSYECVEIDSKHGYTAASAAGSATNGPSALSNTDFERVKCPDAPASGDFNAIYQTAPGTYLVAITTGQYASDNGLGVFDANGYVAAAFWDIPSTAPSNTAADWLQTTVSSISGTTFALATSATTAASGVGITHDDTTPITNAMNASGSPVYFPAGSYFFCGTPLNPSTIRILGAQLGQSTLYMCPNEYLISSSSYTYGIDIRRMTFVGGTGVLDLTYSGALTSGEYSNAIEDDAFIGYTGAAIALEPSTDSPFWKIDHDMFSGLDFNGTIGIMANPSSGNQIEDNNFQIDRIGVKAWDSGSGLLISGNTFIRVGQPQADPLKPRIGIWLVPASSYESGTGFVATANKFGNEGLANDDVQVLVADDNTSSGNEESQYMPLYYTADDLSISAGGTTLTSASECPFTSAMCQGGTGCTGTQGNWPIVINKAGTAAGVISNALTTTITAYTSACSVTVGNAATTTASGAVGRFAPSDTTNDANYLVFAGNFAYSNGSGYNDFMVSTVSGITSTSFMGNRFEVSTILDYLPLLTPTNTGYYGSNNTFVNNPGAPYGSNQLYGMGIGLGGSALLLQRGTNSNGLTANTPSPVLGAYWDGLAVESTNPFAAGADAFDVFANDAATYLLQVGTGGLLKSHNNTLDDGSGNASFAGYVHTGCGGTVTLSSGAATATNSCIQTGRPTECTDNTSTSGAGCSAVVSSGSITLHGTGSDTVSWAQF